jgi:hypothetical protein
LAVEIIEQRLDDLYKAQGVRRPADGTVEFAYKGRSFTIDLTAGNERDFDDAIEPFLEAATEVTGRRKGGTSKKPAPVAVAAPKKKPTAKTSNTTTEADAIREWARGQGLHVSDRGRIADSVKAAYYVGHSKPAAASRASVDEKPDVSTGPEVEEETEIDGFDQLYEDEPYAQI